MKMHAEWSGMATSFKAKGEMEIVEGWLKIINAEYLNEGLKILNPIKNLWIPSHRVFEVKEIKNEK